MGKRVVLLERAGFHMSYASFVCADVTGCNTLFRGAIY